MLNVSGDLGMNLGRQILTIMIFGTLCPACFPNDNVQVGSVATSSSSTSTSTTSTTSSSLSALVAYSVSPIAGATTRGTTITSFGQNFVEGTTVKVGGVSCSSVTVSP